MHIIAVAEGPSVTVFAHGSSGRLAKLFRQIHVSAWACGASPIHAPIGSVSGLQAGERCADVVGVALLQRTDHAALSPVGVQPSSADRTLPLP